MKNFNNIKELLQTLNKEKELISEMFSKRKLFNYKKSDALEILDFNEDRINYLLNTSIIIENDGLLEIDDLFLEFFEQILDVNEEINTSYINENIKNIKENIIYYLNESDNRRRYGYLKFIKNSFRKIGNITLKNVINLRRNIENTFKNEANYKNKKLKLKSLSSKRGAIKALISESLLLINTQEAIFFKTATDEELLHTIQELKYVFNRCNNDLIEIERQIIDYLNQVKSLGDFSEKLKKLKYLQEQMRLDSETNIKQILSNNHLAIFEKKNFQPLNLSINFLQNDENVFSLIKKVAQKHTDKLNYKPIIADNISTEYLNENIEYEPMINLDEIKDGFIATSNNLFDFIQKYDFSKEVDFNERVTIFCQMASQFEKNLKFSSDVQINNNIEYAMIYPE